MKKIFIPITMAFAIIISSCQTEQDLTTHDITAELNEHLTQLRANDASAEEIRKEAILFLKARGFVEESDSPEEKRSGFSDFKKSLNESDRTEYLDDGCSHSTLLYSPSTQCFVAITTYDEGCYHYGCVKNSWSCGNGALGSNYFC